MKPAATPVIVLMAKAPLPGSVKTRLAKPLGSERARAVYRWMVERQLSEIPTDWQVEVHFDPPEALQEMQTWLGENLIFRPQTVGDLGVRMCRAAEGVFEKTPSAVILIGGDCPELHSADLETAAGKLADGADVVYGPAKDGGYYLLGLRQLHPELFENIPWSSAATLDISLAKAAGLGLKVAMLPEKEDVDTVESLDRAIERGSVPADLKAFVQTRD